MSAATGDVLLALVMTAAAAVYFGWWWPRYWKDDTMSAIVVFVEYPDTYNEYGEEEYAIRHVGPFESFGEAYDYAQEIQTILDESGQFFARWTVLDNKSIWTPDLYRQLAREGFVAADDFEERWAQG